jgi:hypothetical protein
MICRSHQLVKKGYKIHYDHKLVTVFLAHNVCRNFNNEAAIIEFGENMVETVIKLD